MSQTVVLDSGPLGLATNPGGSSETKACARWLSNIVRKGGTVVIPEIADYEVRRELIRAQKHSSIARLDTLIDQVAYMAITTAAMRVAAEYWAQARRSGQPATDDAALDGDVILAAQAATIRSAKVVVATTNVKHLSVFVEAKPWHDIS
ncbi:MAG: nuclease [Gammaproteobacteria bacterium]|nr:nuclease [Gammaproteobacteria bacterium]MXW46748.1 type II toxin-antitoxin system VapC family toxin [Gammaproteobacteria bacterium]MYD03280.1 type II toxin-antitoxin system VapC family toxin [Gammaproteobacteria bacterium]MYI24184.1 type II toxin-antitoxin system VapC family toxin [Gammaproteobacteria bacterium]